MIRLENVTKKFRIGFDRGKGLSNLGGIIGRKRVIKALNNVSLVIKDKEKVAIIGPNGSGKSTLLSVIAGILVPETGKVYINEKITSMLFLEAGFHRDLSVKENIFLFGAILGKTRKEISPRIKSIIKFSDLQGFENAELKDLSTGMRQKLAFSVVAFSDPGTLILDEVLAVGDLKFTENCLEILKQVRGYDHSILFVSHYLDLVEKYFDRCIYMKKGKIVADGATKSVIARYKKDSLKKK